jgi:hypothetical protein
MGIMKAFWKASERKETSSVILMQVKDENEKDRRRW